QTPRYPFPMDGMLDGKRGAWQRKALLLPDISPPDRRTSAAAAGRIRFVRIDAGGHPRLRRKTGGIRPGRQHGQKRLPAVGGVAALCAGGGTNRSKPLPEDQESGRTDFRTACPEPTRTEKD